MGRANAMGSPRKNDAPSNAETRNEHEKTCLCPSQSLVSQTAKVETGKPCEMVERAARRTVDLEKPCESIENNETRSAQAQAENQSANTDGDIVKALFAKG